MTLMAVTLPHDVLDQIRVEAEAAYPNEGCGALLGPGPDEVTQLVSLANREGAQPRIRFEVSPADYLRVEDEAERRGLLLLGFWHSHPDHPARPSQTDRRYAWPGLLTLVAGVAQGRLEALTAWAIADADAPFEQLELRNIEERLRPISSGGESR